MPPPPPTGQRDKSKSKYPRPLRMGDKKYHTSNHQALPPGNDGPVLPLLKTNHNYLQYEDHLMKFIAT